MRNSAIIRIRIITSLVLLLASVLVVRLYFLQVVYSHEFVERANQQYVHTAQNIFNRGSIYFTTKSGELVSAAAVRSGFVLAVNPQRVTDAVSYYEKLAPFISTSAEEFIARSTLENRTYVEIESRITNEEAEHIAELGLSGVMLYRNRWRHYPGESLSAQTIGFVAESDDPNEFVRGRYGLERFYDDILAREHRSLSVNIFAGIFANLGSMITATADTTQRGHVVTTLEPTVSRMLDVTLLDINDRYQSSHTGGIIMDPNTGAVIAMSAVPAYNNNNRRGVSVEQFRNPLVENVYEFGSIMKAVTIAAGIDAGAITPQTQFYDTGSVVLDRFTIRNFDGRGRGQVDMQRVLNDSLNTGVSFIVDQMGTSAFRDYLYNLQFNQRSGIDLPNDTRGLTSNLESPRKVEYATASFGQGVAVTPMTMIKTLSALANGGNVVTPHLVQEVIYENQTRRNVSPEIIPGVLKPQTSEQISRMLTNVVDTALRGGGLALPNHTVGAKTGTAQIPNPQTGGYYDNRFLHSFFGYFPAYDPQFIVLLYTVDPQGVRYASETLTDSFMDITSFLINYYEIPPDR